MSKRKRSNSDSVSKKKFRPQGMTIVKTGGTTREFVPRSLGNPLAITERKYFDSELDGSAIGSSTTTWAGREQDPATLNTLFAPITGDDFNHRTGRKVQVIAIKIKGYVNIPAQADQTAADQPYLARIILVQDRQTNAGQLNAEDVISSGGTNQAINMFQNPAFFGRFRVLQDKFIAFSPPTMTYDGTNVEQAGMIRNFKFNIKFRKPVVMHFNSTNGGTVADIVDNSFHIIANAQSSQLAGTLNYKCRTTFIDI